MQETALSSLLERVRPEDMENLASIACQSLDNQDQARLVHDTKDEVMFCAPLGFNICVCASLCKCLLVCMYVTMNV